MGQARAARAPRPRICAALGVALGFGALPAAAHAPPLGTRVLSSESGGDDVIVTNRGLVFREATTGASRLLCNEALHITTAELPNVALLGDGALLVASSSGLRLSRDQGCSWSDVGQMETTNTPALASDPNRRDTVVIASYESLAPGLHVTRDAGASWSRLHATGEGDYVHSIAISGADGARIYATVATYAPSQAPVHSLLRTRDGGVSWARLVLPLTERDYRARAAAIDPTDPDTLILYTVANSPGLDDSRLLVSRDAGDTFAVALERPEIRGAGYGTDGKLWVVARDGLYGSDAELSVFEQRSVASELGCVLERAGALFVCGHFAGVGSPSFGVGVSVDGGQTFDGWLDFMSVAAPVECPAESLTASLCARPWLDWQAEMNGTLPVGAPGAYGPAGTPAVSPAATPSVDGVPPAATPDAAAPARDAAAPDLESDAPAVSCALNARGSVRDSRAGAVIFGLLAALRVGRHGRRHRERG